MTAQDKQINLLPKEKWETGVVGKLLKWVLNIGRYVVVFTELVVILAFLYRFSLDRRLTDLREETKQNQTVVESYAELEEKFKRVQDQLEVIKKTEEDSVKIDRVLEEISAITPIDTFYESISIQKEEVSMEGKTLSETGLATLLYQAQNSQVFTEVVLDSVSSATNQSQTIEFRMNLSLE